MSERNSSIIFPLSMIAAGTGLVLLSRKLLQPRMKLEGQVVLITGGSRGLGLAMAEEFARHGARLVVCARDERELERAETILSETGAEVMALRCDLTDRNQVLKFELPGSTPPRAGTGPLRPAGCVRPGRSLGR